LRRTTITPSFWGPRAWWPADGDRADDKYVNVFPIQDGKVTEAWGMSENDAETDAFFDKIAPS
jgi:hypothetical protein